MTQQTSQASHSTAHAALTAPTASVPPAAAPGRRRLLVGGAALAVAGLLASCSSGTASRSASAQASGALTIGLTYTPNIQFAPFYMALEQGHYAPGVELRHHGAQEGLFDALAAGTEHMVIAGADEAVVASSNGSGLVVIGGFYQRHPACIIVPQDSPITAPADLAGRKVGLPGRMGENWYALQVAMDTAGITEKDLEIQEIGYTQQAALVGGKVDAVIGFSNNDAVQIAQAGTPVRTVAVADDVPLIGASLVTSRTVLQARRDELADAVTASTQGMSAFVEDPDGAVEASKAYIPDLADGTRATQARKVAVATAELIRPGAQAVIGELAASRVSTMIDFLSDHSLLGSTPVSAGETADPLTQG